MKGMKGMSENLSRDAKLGVLEHIQKFMQHLDDQSLTAKLKGKGGEAEAAVDDAGVATDEPIEAADGNVAPIEGSDEEEAGESPEVEASEPASEDIAEGEPSDDEKLKALVKKRLGAK